MFSHHIHNMYTMFIKLTALSADPEARYLPSRENATLHTDSIIIYVYIIYIYIYMVRKDNLKKNN